MAKSIMIQGTASDAGKSIVVAGLCRIFAQDGLRVLPFKSQNMALNSYITATGDEMGRAQVFQAEAAMQEPDVRMNPVLLKPTSDRKSQVIFNGRILGDMDAVEYHEFKPALIEKISQVYQQLSDESEVIVLEGAGSPAEINLNSRDIANMGMARIADAPVLLVADIDKGGVFAAIYGTIALLNEDDRKRIKGIIINKFRGDKQLLEPGLVMIEELTKVPVVGVIPYKRLAIDNEDSVALETVNRRFDSQKELDVAVVCLSRISNFTDFNSLEREPDVSLRYIFPGDAVGTPDLLIIPGSKNTMEDCVYLEETGMAADILQLYQTGKKIIGICGGFQLLGKRLLDPDGVEGIRTEAEGLGLLDITTVFEAAKTTTQAKAIIAGDAVQGYEIHMGKTTGEERPFSTIVEANGEAVQRPEGAVSADGQVMGTYLHGIFDNPQWCRNLLNELRRSKGLVDLPPLSLSHIDFKNREYDKLAQLLRENLAMDKIYQIVDGVEVEG